jgi:hypothetical protein
MRSNPFNSLDEALAKAERTKAESAERKTAIFLIVGLDFGTAYTKCMVRDFNYRRATPLAFEIDGDETFFIPSELTWSGGHLSHPLDGTTDGGQTLSYLKMALAAAATGERSDWLDAVMRPIGVTESQEQLGHIRALVIFYLVGVLRVVHALIGEKWKDFGKQKDDAVFYNMAVPVAHARDASMQAAFRECLNTAVALLQRKAPLPAELPTLVALVEQHLTTDLPICDLMPEVTANVQSYVRSRGGRQGLYLFADVGAGTVDFSIFIYFTANGDLALTYPHAAVELLGSSQLEMRTFQRSQVALTRRLRLLKEGVSRNGDWKMNLTTELNATRAEIRTELTAATECAVSLAKRKLRIWQFQTMQILFGGGGCSPEPYEEGIKAAFTPRWGLTAVSQPLPVPNDVDWPTGQGANLFRRFSVAYGLSFLPIDQPIQRFPDEIQEFGPEVNHPRQPRREAPSKDEV